MNAYPWLHSPTDLGQRHLDIRACEICDLPERGPVAMAQDSTSAGRQDGRHPVTFTGYRCVPDCINAAMQPAQPTLSHTKLDLTPCKPELEQLPRGNDAPLARRKPGESHFPRALDL